MGHQRGLLASRAEAHHGVHHLVRASAPVPRRIDVQREHSHSEYAGWAVGVGLQLPELGEFQEHRIRVHDRNREPDRPVEKASAQHVVPEERRGWVCHEPERSCSLAALVHLPRGERRVVVDAIQLIAKIAKRVVLKLVDELTRPAVDGHRLVDVKSVPPRGPAVVESGLEVRIEVGRPYPASQVVRDARHPVALAGRLGGEQRADLGGQRRRDAFVRVERENPVVRGQAVSEVLLIDVAGPRAGLHASALRSRDGDRVVSASRVHEDDLVGPGGAVDGVGDVFRLVEGDDGDRDLRHTGILRQRLAGLK